MTLRLNYQLRIAPICFPFGTNICRVFQPPPPVDMAYGNKKTGFHGISIPFQVVFCVFGQVNTSPKCL